MNCFFFSLFLFFESNQKKNDKTFGWLFVGSGSITKRVLKEFPVTSHDYLAAVFSRNFSHAQDLTKKFGGVPYSSLEDAFMDKNVKAVYIATPHPFHKHFAVAAMKHKLPVLVEKPFAMNFEETVEMISQASSSEVYLVDGLWTFHNPVIQTALSIIKEGQIGPVLTVEGSFCFKSHFNPTHRVFNPELGGGSVYDLGIYLISLAYFVFGQKAPTEILANATYAPSGTDNRCSMVLRFERGEAKLFCSVTQRCSNSVLITCKDGSVEIPNFWAPKRAFVRLKNSEKEFSSPHVGEGYHFQFDAVTYDIINGRKQSVVVTHNDTLEISAIVDRVYNIVKKEFYGSPGSQNYVHRRRHRRYRTDGQHVH